jgi:hypothetical protein
MEAKAMSTVSRTEIDEVFDRVEAWPEEARRDLLEMILGTLNGAPKPQAKLRKRLGLLKTDGPPPTDEECRQILEEELMRKHLR